MHKYIEDTRFAARSLVALIRQAEEDIERIDNYRKEVRFFQERFVENQFSDRVMLYFRQMMEEMEKSDQVEKEHQDYLTEYFSKHSAIAAVSGALLHIAAQGISLVYGDVGACTKQVRSIESQPIQEVIWAARNQSGHYEEGKYDDRTSRCFSQLLSDFVDEKFAVEKGRGKDQNLAFEIINILNWDNYEQYETDMTLLLEKKDG